MREDIYIRCLLALKKVCSKMESIMDGTIGCMPNSTFEVEIIEGEPIIQSLQSAKNTPTRVEAIIDILSEIFEFISENGLLNCPKTSFSLFIDKGKTYVTIINNSEENSIVNFSKEMDSISKKKKYEAVSFFSEIFSFVMKLVINDNEEMIIDTMKKVKIIIEKFVELELKEK